MYWSRTGNYLELFTWVLLNALIWIGGWLLCNHLFYLRRRERLFAGIASGMLLFLLFSNLLAYFIRLPGAYWAAASLVLGLGGVAAWRSNQRPRLPFRELLEWPQLLAFGTLFVLFVLINRGLALFDDYANLPLVSTIAAGDFPPHFSLNPKVVLDFHYGLHLLAASLVRIGGFFPWSALDIYKAFTIALAALLSVLWYRRLAPWKISAGLGGLFVLFAAGSRWLLLFIPETVLQKMSASLQMMGSALQSAPDLHTALISPWNIAGDGPIPFPFAFANGIISPLTLAMGSSAALPAVTMFLLLLLARRRWRPAPGLLYGLLLSSLILTSEPLFVILWAGILVAAIFRWLLAARRSSKPADRQPPAACLSWLWVLLPGPILAPTMGGVISAAFQRLAGQVTGTTVESGVYADQVALRWPPAILSSHLGSLSLLNPDHWLILLAEMGIAVLLGVFVTRAIPGYVRSGKLVMAGASLMAVMNFLTPMFLRFVERDRDISRLTGAALAIWMGLGLPYLWLAYRRSGKLTRVVAGAVYIIAIVGGLALFPAQMIAAAQTQPSDFVQEEDAWMSRKYWDNLEPEDWVLDPLYPYRPPTLFARTTGPAYRNMYVPLPEYRELVKRFDPVEMARAGYDYLYFDRETWQKLTAEQRRAFQNSCIHPVAEQKAETGDFRRLLDISRCQK